MHLEIWQRHSTVQLFVGKADFGVAFKGWAHHRKTKFYKLPRTHTLNESELRLLLPATVIQLDGGMRLSE